MKSRQLFLTLVICLFTSTTFSQFNLEWANNYQGIGLQFQLWSMDVDNMGNTYAIGNDSAGSKLLKINTSGNTEWVYVDSLKHGKYFVKIDHQSNCVVAGVRIDANYYEFVYVQKFSPQGDLLWDYIYPHYGSDVALELKLDDEDNIYVSFVKRNQNYSVTYGVGLLKLDSDGNHLWDNLNPHNNLWWNRNFEILPDHSIINQYYSWRDTDGYLIPDSHLYKVGSLGETEWQVDSLWQATSDVSIDQFQNSYESAYNDSEFYLLKYDLSGHQLWKKVLFNDVYFHEDDYYGMNKYYYYFTTGKLVTQSALYLDVVQYRNNSGNSEFFKIHLFKIDFNGNILWQYDYLNPLLEGSFGGNLFQVCNSNLILEGYEYPDTFGVAVSQIFLLALDTLGNELYKSTVVLDSIQNTSAVFNGTAVDDSFNIYFCMMDGLTKVQTRKFSYASCPDDVNVDDLTNATSYLKLVPNPTSDAINVEINSPSQKTSFQMMNALGQIVFENELKVNQSSATIDVSHLPVGIYWVVMKTESSTSTQKIVIQR